MANSRLPACFSNATWPTFTSKRTPEQSEPSCTFGTAELILTIIQFLCSILIRNYISTRSRANLDITSNTSSEFTYFSLESQTPAFILNPPPTVFAYAVSVFAISVVAFHSLRKPDLYQDRALYVALIVGLISSGILSILEGHFLPFKNFMPAIVTVTQAISAMWHGHFRTAAHIDNKKHRHAELKLEKG